MLSSLAGDASAIAAVAATDGTVSATSLPAANVTNVTTAEAVLTTQALGKAPASSADIASAQGQFSSARAIKLVADAGVALPGGAADTLVLVSNTATYSSFVTTQATTSAAAFNATQAAVIADPAIAVAPPVPATGSPDVTMVLTLGQGAGATGVTALTLKADGTALIAGAPCRRPRGPAMARRSRWSTTSRCSSRTSPPRPTATHGRPRRPTPASSCASFVQPSSSGEVSSRAGIVCSASSALFSAPSMKPW